MLITLISNWSLNKIARRVILIVWNITFSFPLIYWKVLCYVLLISLGIKIVYVNWLIIRTWRYTEHHSFVPHIFISPCIKWKFIKLSFFLVLLCLYDKLIIVPYIFSERMHIKSWTVLLMMIRGEISCFMITISKLLFNVMFLFSSNIINNFIYLFWVMNPRN